MAESVVICEKSSQAKDIKAAVGSKFGIVLPASGHILTLKEPDEVREDWKTWSAELLWPGEFYPKAPVDRTRSLLADIRRELQGAKRVIIATDCDREGQLIGDEIVEYLGFTGDVYRAMFTAQDPKSLQKAFSNLEPNEKYRGMYMAGQAREQADQITNLSLTRTATTVMKAPGTKGAIGIGRVKTPVLGIVCKRELEIENFKPQDMFEIDATTEVAAGALLLTCAKMPASLLKEQEAEDEGDEEDELAEGEEALAEADSLRGKILDKRIADGLIAAAKGYQGKLSAKFEKKKQKPPKLFDLSAMQAACSSKFGWGGEQTLNVAQSLYAAPHHILTYPRGEAQYLPENEIPNVPALVSKVLECAHMRPHQELLANPQVRKGKDGHFSDKALEGFSHYAIIPNINAPRDFADVYPSLSSDQKKLFDLVAKQYIAAMAPDYEYRQTTVEMMVPWKGHDWSFKNSGRVPIFLGWKEILGAGSGKNDGDEFPEMKNGEPATIVDAASRTVTTRPPARYTEGSLIKVMKEAWRLVDDPKQRARLKEATGIGTAATRGDVLKGLLAQDQLTKAGKSIKPTPGGMVLYKTLMAACPNVVDPGRTAIWETIFDHVQAGKMTALDAVKKINGITLEEIAKIRSSGVQITIGRAMKPTKKMLAAVESIKKREGLAKLPVGVTTDMGKCRAFLEQHLGQRPKNPDGTNAPYPPSAKQIELAQSLAERTGLDIPEEATKSAKAMSDWIDAAMKKAPPKPPSPKQLELADRLSEGAGMEIPESARQSAAELSAWIDKAMKKQPARPPSPKQLALAERLAGEAGEDLPANCAEDMKACSAYIDGKMGGSSKKSGGKGKK